MRRLLLAIGQIASVAAGAAAEPTVRLLEAAEGVLVGPTPDAPVWAELEARGVQTVVGVEGLPPAQPTGHGRGVRLVHIPIGYDGVDRHAAELLTRVAREADRPLYVYCHHGQHRGPAAAAIVCRAAGLLDQAGAADLLRRAETDPQYVGLWSAVSAYRPPPPDAVLPELTAASPTPPLRLAMCQLDRAWDASRRATTRVERRDAHLLVVESLRESLRGVVAEGSDLSLVEQLREAIESAAAHDSSDLDQRSPDWPGEFEQRCHACHATHRDDRD